MGIFNFYHDTSLTQIVDAATPIQGTQYTDGSLPAVDSTIYFGGATPGYTGKVQANPGVDIITVSVVDAASGSGSPASEVKLALSLIGLDSATPGAALNLATATVTSGAANRIPVYIRRASALTTPQIDLDLSLQTQLLIDTPV